MGCVLSAVAAAAASHSWSFSSSACMVPAARLVSRYGEPPMASRRAASYEQHNALNTSTLVMESQLWYTCCLRVVSRNPTINFFNRRYSREVVTTLGALKLAIGDFLGTPNEIITHTLVLALARTEELGPLHRLVRGPKH